MIETEKNNIFLSAWYIAVYDFMMHDSVNDNGFPLSISPIFHFYANIMMGLYPDNTIFKKLLEKENVYSPDNNGIFQGIFNQTLWEAQIASYFGTYWADIEDETKFYQTDIKKGDILLVHLKNSPPEMQMNMAIQVYLGDNCILGHDGYELEELSIIEKSVLTEKGSTLVGVLRYNFNRTDSYTPAGAEDIAIWEDFWNESYTNLNALSYNQDHSLIAKRELLADIDIVDNIVSINTDISPVPVLEDFFEIWLLDDCLCCFKDFIPKENEYIKNLKSLPAFVMCGGVGYGRYNWTLRFNASKYNTVKNYLELNNISYKKIN
jgi:hypothetical protein